MSPAETAVVVVDVQAKLLPHIDQGDIVERNVAKLLNAAAMFAIPGFVTEQYPKGLGPTTGNVTSSLPSGYQTLEKLMFSCRECEAILSALPSQNRHNVLLAGIESHVCVMQSALDLLSAGFDVFACVDAMGSRFTIDHQTAIRRMELSGVTLVTMEMVLFEWCEIAGSQQFKQISQLAKDRDA